jgi:hypothetical protein
MSTLPTPDEIQTAARKLQQGGHPGRGSSRAADKLITRAGDNGQAVAFAIINAAVDYEPRPPARYAPGPNGATSSRKD